MFKSQLVGTKCLCKHPDLQNVWCDIVTSMSNFQPLEIVDRGSETQLQEGDFFKCNALTLSILTLPLSSSSTTSRELLPQFSTCSG